MENSLYIGLFLFLAFLIFSMIRFFIYQHKLMQYLLEYHTEKWKDLTTVWGFGPGLANSFRGMKFLFGKDDLGDSEVLRLKVIVRNSFIHTLGGMFTIFFWWCFMVAIMQSHK